MKKVFVFGIAVMAIFFAVINTVGAEIYTETKDLDTWLSGRGTYSWAFSTPPDFSVPPYLVNSATLTVSGWLVDGSNDKIYVENSYRGVLENGSIRTLGFSSSNYNIGSVFTNWTAGSAVRDILS